MDKHPTKIVQEERRKQVAANLLAGLSYREIADAMNIGIGTISRDANIIIGRMKQEQVTAMTEARTLDARRLDRTLRAIWETVLKGDLPTIDRFLRIMERRAKLLGLDAPNKSELTGQGGEAMEINVTANAAEDLTRRLLPELTLGGAATTPEPADGRAESEPVL